MTPSAPGPAEAFWITGALTGEIRAAGLPPPGDGEVLVRTLYSGISRGTECLVFGGGVPASQYRAMRAPFQEGDFPWPVKYGYASVGLVEQGPDALQGREVFCLYPHQTRYLVPEAAVLPLPRGLPAGRAVLGANMETALNGLWDAAPRPGDRIAVIGAGVVGCLVARLAAQVPGCRVQLLDIDPDKAAIAEALGLPFALPEAAEADCDLVIHASGAPEGLVTALGLAGFEATVVELSWFGDRGVTLPLGEAFHARRLTLKSSQVGQVASARRARWDHCRRLAKALELLAEPRLDALISGDSAFRALPETLRSLYQAPAGVLCHRITYED
ncbi:MAG: dehydrogenase [Kiloniellales bacterium]|nr:dehydrogenase [Kiloniellales bacterium]